MPCSADLLRAARAKALFVSPLSATGSPSAEEATHAIRAALRVHGGSRGCEGEVAAIYGDYPDTAASRMRWALATVERLYTKRDVAPGRRLRAVVAA
ncbi:hypothetical protein [Spongiactinospora sp. TRM90649]|uniref:hypothetical protein n=1 Tax=Spongiactinospora sp. TRM90649 TaxID=3031114 RepID=UPI0023F6B1F9|nr:hypothetical protein [Spongiactinospora sp. TRM90649]MDF5758335.1 hypothetical protein [Spongiactinospora sp. TRM90649]